MTAPDIATAAAHAALRELCETHGGSISAAIHAELALIERIEGERDEYRREKDAAYWERNQVVRALATLFPSGITRTDIPGWHPEWHGCVYINLPTGQVSWHYHDSQAELFADLPPYNGKWDGHDTAEKYRRLAALTAPDTLKLIKRQAEVIEALRRYQQLDDAALTDITQEAGYAATEAERHLNDLLAAME